MFDSLAQTDKGFGYVDQHFWLALAICLIVWIVYLIITRGGPKGREER